MVGVDVEAQHLAGRAQLQHAPVAVAVGSRARHAAATALPAVHPLAAIGVAPFDEDAAARLNQVLRAGKEVVAGTERTPAQRRRGEIDEAGETDGDGLAHGRLRASRPSKVTPRADGAGSTPS